MPVSMDSPRPDINKVNFDDPKQAAQFQRETAAYNLMIQTMTQANTEESNTKSNMAKTRHEAMMAIINNLK